MTENICINIKLTSVTLCYKYCQPFIGRLQSEAVGDILLCTDIKYKFVCLKNLCFVAVVV